MRNLLSLFGQSTSRLLQGDGGLRSRLAALARGQLFRASTISVLDQAVVSGTNFATSVIIGRSTGASELGMYYLALTIVFFSRGVQEQLVGAPYMIYCQRKTPETLKTFGGSALVHQIALSIVAVFALVGFWLVGRAPDGFEPVLMVLAGVLPLLLMREFVREMAFAHLRPAVALSVDVGIAVGQLGTLFALSRFELLNVPLAYLVMGGASGVAALVWFLLKKQPLVATRATAWADWWANWAFSRWALASQLLGQTTAYIMPWVLAATHDEAATGVFGACTTLVGLANMFVLGLGNFLSPRAAQAFAKGGLSELKTVLGQTIGIFLASIGSFAAASFFIGEYVAALLYGETVAAGTGPIIGILALGVVANSVSMACGNGLWAMERPAANFAADVCVMLTVVIGSLTLIPLFGSLGAAVATLLAHATAASVRGYTLLYVMGQVARQEAKR